MGDELTFVLPRYALKPPQAGSEAAQRHLTRLPLRARPLISPGLSRSLVRPAGGSYSVGDGLGEADSDGDGLGDVVRDGVGDAEVGVTPPVQVTPLRVKVAGAGLLDPFQVALNPNAVFAPVAMGPL